MKKLILGAILLFSLIGCEEDITEDCNCGLVVSDNVYDYSVDIRSDCSGNIQTFYLSEGDWMNAHPGSNFCITNETGW
jgi:hypothetical protein